MTVFLNLFQFFSKTNVSKLRFLGSIEIKGSENHPCISGQSQFFLHKKLSCSEMSNVFEIFFSKLDNFNHKIHYHILDFGFNPKQGCGKRLCKQDYAQTSLMQNNVFKKVEFLIFWPFFGFALPNLGFWVQSR